MNGKFNQHYFFKNKTINIWYLILSLIFCNSIAFSAPSAELAHPVTSVNNTFDAVKYALSNRNPKIVGYTQVDYAHYVSTKTRLGDGEEIRRLYLGVVGNVTPNWGYTTIVDFAKNQVLVRDAWLAYTGFHPTRIRIGNMKEPLSLEHLTADVDATFLERALPITGFFPDRRIGIDVDSWGQFIGPNFYTISVGLFGVDVGHTRIDESDDGYSGDARLTYAFKPSDTELIHLGLFATLRRPDSSNTLNFSTKPESDVTNVTFVNTGLVKQVRSFETFGPEFAGVYGPFSLQGEYFGTRVNRQSSFKTIHIKKRTERVRVSNPNLEFKGWYGYISLFLTGESRPYDVTRGVFTTVVPLHDYGAWEIALRYSDLNLTDHTVIGGQEHNITFGLNWYVNKYVRFFGDYIKVYANKGSLHNEPSIYTVRAQISFL